MLRHWTKGRRGDLWGPDDYDVMSGDQIIGRIFKPGAGVPAERPWEWTIITGGASRGYGFAETREQPKVVIGVSSFDWR